MKVVWALNAIDSTDTTTFRLFEVKVSNNDLYSQDISKKKLSIEDFIYRKWFNIIINISTLNFNSDNLSQFILERNAVKISDNDTYLRFSIRTPFPDNQIHLITEVIDKWVHTITSTGNEMENYCRVINDQIYLRTIVSNEGLGFVANGSILARTDRLSDKPIPDSIPFQSPPSLEVEYLLPHSNMKIKGMLIPRGVTIVTGGGFHGKSTLLRALATGVYNKVPGDGREFVVMDPGTVSVRAEDGRYINGVNVSPFIGSLPKYVTCDPTCFSTSCASGSTSQAANVMEYLEIDISAFLMDEDTCAANFMTRDSRMRAMIAHEPITPYIYRINAIWNQCGVSTVLAVGGCGDWFDVHTTTLMMDDYLCTDATSKATSISKTFSHGRVQYNGRGLVHRLSWPWDHVCKPRYPVVESVRALVDSEITVQAGGGVVKFGCGEDSRTSDLSRVLDLVPEMEKYVTGVAYCIRWLAQQCTSDTGPSTAPEGVTICHSRFSLLELLRKLEVLLQLEGVAGVVSGSSRSASVLAAVTPRMSDVAAAFNRVSGVKFTYRDIEDRNGTSGSLTSDSNDRAGKKAKL